MGTHRFSFAIHKPGHVLDEEETIVRAYTREEADEIADARAKSWGVKLQFVGERHGERLEVQIPVDELPKSWRAEVAA